MKKKVKFEKYLPTYRAKSIYDIDFKSLSSNYQVIFFDLDNTLIEYDVSESDSKLFKLLDQIQDLGFSDYIISNSKQKRVSLIAQSLDLKYLSNARKPFTSRIKKLIKSEGIDINKVIFIGDQLMTDICCANKLKCSSILVDPINSKNEPIATLFNRLRQRKIYKYFEENKLFKEYV